MSEYIKMVTDLTKPASALIAGMTETRVNIMHAMLGINDELLELHVALEEKDMVNLLEELGDLLFYTEMLGQEIGIEITDVSNALTHFTLPDIQKFETIRNLAGEAVTFAKRIGIYAKPYETNDLEVFYVKMQMLLKFVAKEYSEELYDAFSDTYSDVEMENPSILEVIQEANMQKLLKGDTARYKSGSYSDEQANARADKA